MLLLSNWPPKILPPAWAESLWIILVCLTLVSSISTYFSSTAGPPSRGKCKILPLSCLKLLVWIIKVDGGDGDFSVYAFRSCSDEKICAKNLFKERSCPCLALLHDISADSDCAVSCRNRVRNQIEVTVGSELFLELYTTHCNAGEKYVLPIWHLTNILVTAIVGKHVNDFKHFAHPENVEVEVLVLLPQT